MKGEEVLFCGLSSLIIESEIQKVRDERKEKHGDVGEVLHCFVIH